MSDNYTRIPTKKIILAIICAVALVIGGCFLMRMFMSANEDGSSSSNTTNMTMTETPIPASSTVEEKPIDISIKFGESALTTETTLSQILDMLEVESFYIDSSDYLMFDDDETDNDSSEKYGLDYLSSCQVEPHKTIHVTVKDDSIALYFKLVNTSDDSMKLGDLAIYSFYTSKVSPETLKNNLLASKISVMNVHVGEDATKIIEELGEPISITSNPDSDDEGALLMKFLVQGYPLDVYVDANYVVRAFSVASYTEDTDEDFESSPNDEDAWHQSRMADLKNWWENSRILLENKEITLGKTTLSEFSDGLSLSFNHNLDEEFDPDDFDSSIIFSEDSLKVILELQSPSKEKTSFGETVITGISLQTKDENTMPESSVIMIGDFSCTDSPVVLVDKLGRPTVRSGNTYRYQTTDGEHEVSSLSLFFRNGHLISVAIE